jgi:hypothetical protein
MTIHCKISHLDRTVVGVSEGVVTLKDIREFLDAVVKAHPQPYAKIFDATHGTSGLSDADVKTLAVRLHASPRPSKLGPFAIVARSERSDLATLLRPFASLDRPMRLFRDIHRARQRLAQQHIVV